MLVTARLSAATVFTGIVLAVAAANPAPVPKGVWPVFRGTTEQTGVARSSLPTKLDVLWTLKTEDAFENAVAVADGTVFAGSMDEHLYALDLATGKVRWKYKAGPFKAPPAVRGSRVYVGDLDGVFHCVDAEKGTKVWSFDTGAELGGANFHGDDVLVASHDEHLYCLSNAGKLRWKFKTDGPIYGSVAVADGRTFLVGCDSQLHILDIATGTQERSVDLEGQTGATAAVVGDILYIGTMKNEVRAIDWKKGAPLWTFKPGRNAQAFFSSPAVTDRQVVVGSRDNRLYCIDAKKGDKVWAFATGGRVDSSPVIAGTRIVVGSLDGKLYVVDRTSGKETAQIELDGPIVASPVLVDGRLLIGTEKGTLYCLGARK
ncbi:MAG: PQQ-binding-like beta-propeller repeat protein [Gemmataceae bacterium]